MEEKRVNSGIRTGVDMLNLVTLKRLPRKSLTSVESGYFYIMYGFIYDFQVRLRVCRHWSVVATMKRHCLGAALTDTET